MTTASLVESISIDGIAGAASGTAYFFQPGTTTQATVYQSATASTVYAQPVVLDANGKSIYNVFATGPVRMMVFSQAGVLLSDADQENVVTASQMALNNAAWSSPDMGTALTAIAQSFGAGDGKVRVPGTGAVARTLSLKLNEPYVSVADFGAVGDGVNDDTPAIIAAVAVIKAAGSGELFFPSGTYKTTTSVLVNISGYFRVRGNGKSSVLAPNFAGTVFTIQAATGVNFQSITHSGTTASFVTISSAALSSLFMMDTLVIGTGTVIWSSAPVGTTCTFVACRSYTDVDGGTIGPLTTNTPGNGVVQTVLGCIGNIGGVGSAGMLARLGGYGNVTSSSASGTVSVAGGGGVVNVTSPAPSPVILGPVSTVYAPTLGTDTAVDSVFTITATGTVAVAPVQGMITLKANTAGITATVQLTPVSRLNAYQTLLFWNNTGGAVTWAAGTGITFRAGVPAPGAGLKVYVTFIADQNTGTYVEVART